MEYLALNHGYFGPSGFMTGQLPSSLLVVMLAIGFRKEPATLEDRALGGSMQEPAHATNMFLYYGSLSVSMSSWGRLAASYAMAHTAPGSRSINIPTNRGDLAAFYVRSCFAGRRRCLLLGSSVVFAFVSGLMGEDRSCRMRSPVPVSCMCILAPFIRGHIHGIHISYTYIHFTYLYVYVVPGIDPKPWTTICAWRCPRVVRPLLWAVLVLVGSGLWGILLYMVTGMHGGPD